MISRIMLSATVGAMLLAAPALAAVGAGDPAHSKRYVPTDRADQCIGLQDDVDAIVNNPDSTLSADTWATAAGLRHDGAALCATYRYDAGIAKLQAAMHAMGQRVDNSKHD